MELEDLKKSWQEQTARLDKLEQQNAELRLKLNSNRLSGSKGKLQRIYRSLTIMSIVMIPISLITFKAIGIPYYVNIMMAAYFAQSAVVNFYVLMLIKEIDITRVSVKDALAMVINIFKTRRRLRIVECILVIPLMFMLFYSFISDSSAIVGAIVGGVTGGIVGLKKEFEIRALLRDMQADLQDLLSD